MLAEWGLGSYPDVLGLSQYLRDVLLADHAFPVLDLLRVVGYEDPFSLAAVIGLADECSCFLCGTVGMEISIAVQGKGDYHQLQKAHHTTELSPNSWVLRLRCCMPAHTEFLQGMN